MSYATGCHTVFHHRYHTAVDVHAAVGSNLGATANKLLVLIATYNGGGSGTFYTALLG